MIENLDVRLTAIIEPDGSLWFPGETKRPPPGQPKPRVRYKEPFAKKCCGTGYRAPHVEGCKQWR